MENSDALSYPSVPYGTDLSLFGEYDEAPVEDPAIDVPTRLEKEGNPDDSWLW
jgi:hypothetical protein